MRMLGYHGGEPRPHWCSGAQAGESGLHCAAARKPEGESPQNEFPRGKSAQKGVAHSRRCLCWKHSSSSSMDCCGSGTTTGWGCPLSSLWSLWFCCGFCNTKMTQPLLRAELAKGLLSHTRVVVVALSWDTPGHGSHTLDVPGTGRFSFQLLQPANLQL